MTIVLFALACTAPSAEDITATSAALGADSAPVFKAEITDYLSEDDGPLLAQIVEQFPGKPASFGAVLAEGVVEVDGYISLAMPAPPVGETSAEYRVVIRQAMADGSGGAIRELWPPSIVWSYDLTPGAAPAGWSIREADGGHPAWRSFGIEPLILGLRPVEEFTVGGPFAVPDVSTDEESTVAIALLAGGEVVEGVVGAVDNGVWGLHLEGPPDTEGGMLQPVAYVDSDGFLGFDPETEAAIGVACVRDTGAFLRWFDEPSDVAVADQIVHRHQSVGWNALTGTSGPKGRAVLEDRVRMSASCD